MFGFLRNRASPAKFPVELRDQLASEDVIVMAEKVGVVVHLSGHVPGVFSASSAARFQGSFAVTTTRVVATMPTGADPHLRAIDCGWDMPRTPGRVRITAEGLQMDIDLRAVDHAFGGSMKVNYTHDIPADMMAKLPATRLFAPVDPIFVCRAAGVRPKS